MLKHLNLVALIKTLQYRDVIAPDMKGYLIVLQGSKDA